MIKKLILPIILAFLLVPLVNASVLSIDRTFFESNVAEVRGDAWKVLVRGDSSPEYIIGGSGEQLTGIKDGNSVYAKDGFELKFSVDSQKCKYKLFRSYEQDVVTYSTIYLGNQWLWNVEEVMKSGCYDKYQDIGKARRLIIAKNTLRGYELWCTFPTKIGVPGSSTTSATFTASVGLRKIGESEQTEIKTFELGSLSEMKDDAITIGDKGALKWVGSSWTGENCPSPSDQQRQPIHIEDDWTFMKSSEYTNYISKISILESNYRELIYQNDFEAIANAKSNIESWIADVNIATNSILSKDNIAFDGVSASISDSSLSNGQAVINLPKDHFILKPDFLIYLRADWLGVVMPVGDPEITSIPKVDFVEGQDSATAKINVKNIGDAEGEFGISGISCSGPFSFAGTQRTLLVDVGQTDTFSVPVTTTTNQAVCGSCDIKVYDRNFPANLDTGKIEMCAKPITFCVEGEKRCLGEVAQICNVEGQWVSDTEEPERCVEKKCTTDSDCEKGQVCVSGNCIWKDEPGPSECLVKCEEESCWIEKPLVGGCLFVSPICKANCYIKALIHWIAGGLAVIGFLIVLLITRSALNKKITEKNKKYNIWISIVAGLVAGLLIYLITLYLWWLVLIILIILLILKFTLFKWMGL